MSSQDIVEFILFPVVNEGCRIVAEGIVDKPGDLDVSIVFGMGFPPYRGRPHQVGRPRRGLPDRLPPRGLGEAIPAPGWILQALRLPQEMRLQRGPPQRRHLCLGIPALGIIERWSRDSSVAPVAVQLAVLW